MYIDNPLVLARPLAFLSSCSILILFFNLSALVYAANVTVDDQLGDELSGLLPEYSPEDSWSQGNNCSTCALRPDPANAFQNSWHDTTFYAGGSERTISVNFTGVAVYAFFIIPDEPQGHAAVGTDLIFTLDGEQAGNYSHSPSGGVDFLYNVPCFVNENLDNSSHELVVSAAAPGNGSTAVLFDYLIYTNTNNSSPSNSSTGASPSDSSIHASHVSTGAVVGGVIGGVAAALLLLVLFLYYRRSRTKHITPAGLQSPTTEVSTRASQCNLFPSHETPSEFEVHPAVFDEPKPEDVSSTSRRDPYLRSTEKRSLSAQQHRTSMTTGTTENRPISEPSTSSNNTTDIVSQVAALQATVLSLQEQRLNYHHSNISEVEEPPAYSNDL